MCISNNHVSASCISVLVYFSICPYPCPSMCISELACFPVFIPSLWKPCQQTGAHLSPGFSRRAMASYFVYCIVCFLFIRTHMCILYFVLCCLYLCSYLCITILRFLQCCAVFDSVDCVHTMWSYMFGCVLIALRFFFENWVTWRHSAFYIPCKNTPVPNIQRRQHVWLSRVSVVYCARQFDILVIAILDKSGIIYFRRKKSNWST